MHRNKWYTKLQSAKVHLVTLHIDCRHFLPLSTCPERGLDLSLKQFKYFQPLSTCPERGLELSLKQFKYFHLRRLRFLCLPWSNCFPQKSRRLLDTRSPCKWCLDFRKIIASSVITQVCICQSIFIQGDFFNWASPEYDKCWPESDWFQKKIPDWPPPSFQKC